jgi:PKD repeat protein
VYQTPGTYTIVLTITDDQGHTASATKSGFAVSDDKPQVPAPVITPNPPVRGQTAIFDASSSTAAPGRTIVSYQWTFSGGNPATSSGTTASVVFPTSGAKTYQLTVTDNTGKSTTKTFTVSVVDPPTGSGGRH